MLRQFDLIKTVPGSLIGLKEHCVIHEGWVDPLLLMPGSIPGIFLQL
ncbi:MAG: hypothetical protein CM15mP74_03200 [Halieaceae bacterium]|nr:MAG: hypothetical protein CM15mP74_03200 [Halieaceae bacterium]